MAVTTEDIYFVLDGIRGRRWKEDLPDVDCWTTYQYAIITVARDRDSDSERLLYFGRVIYSRPM